MTLRATTSSFDEPNRQLVRYVNAKRATFFAAGIQLRGYTMLV